MYLYSKYEWYWLLQSAHVIHGRSGRRTNNAQLAVDVVYRQGNARGFVILCFSVMIVLMLRLKYLVRLVTMDFVSIQACFITLSSNK